MEKKLILRGMIAGGIAGLLAFVFARIFAEPKIQAAIDYESARDAAQDVLDKAKGITPPEAGPDIFSRTIQGNVGIGVGIIAFGIAMGALVAVVYCICLGRVGRITPRALSLLVAAGGFLGFYFVPFVKYPANPPSIGHEDTIKQRGILYLIIVAASIIFLVVAVRIGQTLRSRLGNWNAALIAGVAFIAVMTVLMIVLPSTGELHSNRVAYGNFGTETPQPLRDSSGKIVFPGFPADILFTFRLYSVGAQLLLWTVIGLVFAPLAERVVQPEMRERAAQPVSA